eukprot:809131-Prorocentrum_lima.AAC.1
MHLKQSRMHPSTWLLIQGPTPKDQQLFAEPVPPDINPYMDQGISDGEDCNLCGRLVAGWDKDKQPWIC